MSKKRNPKTSIRIYQFLGGLFVLGLIGGMGSWSVYASIQGAVIAPAQIIVKANSKQVQHLEGGIVAEILVTEGQEVNAGNVLLRLDTTQHKASLAALDANLNELLATTARLIAERDELPEAQFPQMLIKRANTNPKIAQILKGQQSLLQARRQTITGQKKTLNQRIAQLQEAIKGLDSQIQSKQKQLGFIRKELNDLKGLQEKGLVPQNRIHALQREEARLEGEQGELLATKARTNVQIGETELHILQIRKEQLAESLTLLRETTTRTNELQERRAALQDKIKRMEIRAPKSGNVHNLNIHTIGGVVAPGDPVLIIVPKERQLIFLARVEPTDIDHLYLGQLASVQLTAFDQTTTPEVMGAVTLISAETTQDTPTSLPYYKIHIELKEDQLELIKDKQLIPGMNADVFIQTKSRPVIEYLMQPLTDQLRRTMREP